MAPLTELSNNTIDYGAVATETTGLKIALTMKEEAEDRRPYLNCSLSSGVEEDDDDDMSTTMDKKIKTGVDPLKLTYMDPLLPTNEKEPTLWSCPLSNAHNLVHAAEDHALFHKHRATVLATTSCCGTTTTTICTFLAPQYSKFLGFRLVPYIWTCRPVQLSALCRQLGVDHVVVSFNDKHNMISSSVQPVVVKKNEEDASKEENFSHGLFEDHSPSCLSNTLVESKDKLVQSSSTTATSTTTTDTSDHGPQEQDNDETSTLAGEDWTDDPEELWEVSMSEDGDDHDFFLCEKESVPCFAPSGKFLAQCAVDLSSAAAETTTTTTGEDTTLSTTKQVEESDSLNLPCIERRESADIMENMIHQAESKATTTTEMQLVDMSFSEQEDSERKLLDIAYYENLFHSPAINRNCIPELIGSTCKEDVFAEGLADLLDTSTDVEDHVRDFSDLLTRDFDALCEATLDLDQQPQSPDDNTLIEHTKMTSIVEDESERALQCIADLAFPRL